MYFEGFPDFIYDPDEPPPRQFDRLAEKRGWSFESPARKMALRELNTALFRQFDPSYEDYSAVVEVDWPKVAEEPTAVPAVAVSSDITEVDQTAPEDSGTKRMVEEKPAGQTGRTLEHLDAFFSKYPQFKRDPTKSVATQLNELRRQEKWWGRRSNLWDAARQKYQNALVQQFNTAYGTDANDLKTWHRVLGRIHAGKLPQTVDECTQLVGSVFVNLVDLVEASADSDERRVKVFQTEEALSSYTVKTRKYFPRKHACVGDVLRCFLH